MINRDFFFAQVRARLVRARLGTLVVSGLSTILDHWEIEHGGWDRRWLAYALATAWHETAFTMQPIGERGDTAYFKRMYDRRSPLAARRAIAAALGNDRDGDGVLFRGRGYAQLTGRRNYRLMGETFDVDLTSDSVAADRALEPGLAARIMFKGMHEGLFTGRRFSHYFTGKTSDWRNARRIINGLDRADQIAHYARTFQAAING